MGRGKYKPAALRKPPRPCGCGRCGLTIARVVGQQSRRWAAGCPNYKAIFRMQYDAKTCPPEYLGRRRRKGTRRSKYE